MSIPTIEHFVGNTPLVRLQRLPGDGLDLTWFTSSLDQRHDSVLAKTMKWWWISHAEAPAFAFQGHPEASPGPHDVASLFDRFVDLMQQHRAGQSD